MKFTLCAGLIGAICAIAPLQAQTNLPQSWNVAAGEMVDSCPAIGANGTIYVTAWGTRGTRDVEGGRLVAVNAAGRKLWDFKISSDIRSSPALGTDDTIYFGGRDRKFYAVGADGKEKWSFGTGDWIDSSAAIAVNGTIYFGGWDHKFYALNPDGTKKWEFSTGGPIDSSPAIDASGTIYFGSHDKNFYALNPDGSKRWTIATGGVILSSPAIDADGVVYFTSVDGKLYALDSDGTEKWHSWTGGTGESSPVIGSDGITYLGVTNTFCAIKPGGAQKWYFGYPIVRGTAAIAADGIVYFAGSNEGVGLLYAFDLGGRLTSADRVGAVTTSSPAIAEDGTVYLGSHNLNFTAFKGNAGLAKSAWPKFRGNAAQNGRVGGGR